MAERKARASWFDNFIGFFSPRAKLQRVRAKMVTDLIERKYEGASSGRRTDGWVTHSTDSNSEVAGALSRLRDRSRDLVRNNPWASRGVQVIEANVIGRGIMGQIKVEGTGGVRRERQLNQIWRAWTQTNAIDFEGRMSLREIQRMMMRSTVESGEVIARRRRVSREKVRFEGQTVEIPAIKVQMLESDFIDSTILSAQAADSSNRIIQGIELTPEGRRAAYHLFQDHPGSLSFAPVNSYKSQRVDAKDVLHAFRPDRPGQLRGVPWLSSVMIRLRDFDEYEDAQLMRQKIASMYTAFVHDLEGLDADLTDAEKCELGEKMEPGLIEILPPGKSIEIARPPAVTGYKEYTSTVLHSIASGLGITYESLTGDLAEVNFSSARMGWLEMHRNIEAWRWQIMMSQVLNPIFDWFLESVELMGVSTAGAKMIWTPPRREMIDPTKEVPAQVTAVRAGFKSLSDAIRESGADPETLLNEISSDNELLDRLNLTLDTDPRKKASEENNQ